MKKQNRSSPEATAAKTARPSLRRLRGKPALCGARQQRGIVLFFALIVLVILLIGGIAVVRMTNASLLGAGNLAFRRDLTVQSDVVIAKAAQALTITITDKTQNLPSANYSAQILAVNAQGIPKALLTDSNFNSVGVTRNDFSAGAQNSGVTIRYIIERMCKTVGGVTPDNCVQVPGSGSGGGSASPLPPPTRPGVVYRLSARVTGPRDTQAFFQTTLSGPS